MKYIVVMLALLATSAQAGQCPNGQWMDRMEYCDRPIPVLCSDGRYRNNAFQCPENIPNYVAPTQCQDGKWRDDANDCPEADRPVPRPVR